MSENLTTKKENFVFSCPAGVFDHSHILLAHGGGGTLMHQLIEKVFLPAFSHPGENDQHDAAVVSLSAGRLAFTTDSYVVQPIFFPGGDIGKLAVHGTVNDLSMAGARPKYLSAGFILEEGLPMETLQRVVESMRQAAQECGVRIITGDTKVVDRGKADGIFINTAGIGVIEHDQKIAPAMVREGDVILLNGDIGRHGMAIMAVREGLEFESSIESDTAPLAGLVMTLLSEGIEIHCMRDLTRGGLASALNEIAVSSGKGMQIEETAIPVRQDVSSACEILGLDPLYVANEGRFITFVAPKDGQRALDIMRTHCYGKDARVIGKVTDEEASAIVRMKSRIGTIRIVDTLSGEQLPRIC